ncbi:hypothetical protein BT93_H1817 [Corymbia citriodora subsp. variegata]|nr:hypothetical protein BT93_H1817 [Corymbia citriodora subsp. variegata]
MAGNNDSITEVAGRMTEVAVAGNSGFTTEVTRSMTEVAMAGKNGFMTEVAGSMTEVAQAKKNTFMTEVTGSMTEVAGSMTEVTGSMTEVADAEARKNGFMTEVIESMTEVAMAGKNGFMTEVTGSMTEVVEAKKNSSMTEVAGSMTEVAMARKNGFMSEGTGSMTEVAQARKNISMAEVTGGMTEVAVAEKNGFMTEVAEAEARKNGFMTEVAMAGKNGFMTEVTGSITEVVEAKKNSSMTEVAGSTTEVAMARKNGFMSEGTGSMTEVAQARKNGSMAEVIGGMTEVAVAGKNGFMTEVAGSMTAATTAQKNGLMTKVAGSMTEVARAENNGLMTKVAESMTEVAIAEKNGFTTEVAGSMTEVAVAGKDAFITNVAGSINEVTMARKSGFTTEVAGSMTEGTVARKNGFMSEVVMAANNGFMTGLLALLKTDDDDFMNKVTSQPCSPTGQVDVKYCLSLVEKILNQAMDFTNDVADNTRAKGNQGQNSGLTSPFMGTSVALSSIINKLYDKIKALQTNDAQQTMETLLVELSSFSWAAKAILTLLALSVYYVENWRHAQIQAADDVLCFMARLRGLPTGTSFEIQRTKAFVNLIKETLAFTKCVVDFMSYSKDSGEISAYISANFYYIFVIVLGCSVLFRAMISERNEFLEQDLLTFLNRVMTICQSFKERVQYFEQKEEEHLYKKIDKVSNSCTDIVELLSILFCTNGLSNVYQCFERTTVKVEELKNKSVMLLISDLNLSNDDLATLTSIYNASTFKSNNYEIMWVPITEAHDEAMQKQFLDMRSRMQWYACSSTVSKTAAKFIQKKWQFTQQTKVVVLDQQGAVVNMDAMTMIRLWGWKAFPFTQPKGIELWNTQGINWFELVVDKTIYPFIEHCFERKDLLFLYDSAEDSKTIREIEEYLEKINYSVSHIAIRISTKREQFLTRLENCISSKMQATSNIYDSLTQELLELYTSYKRHGGFAIIARGSSVVVNARLTDFATVLSKHQTWIKRVTQTQAFESVFQEHYKQVIVKPRCHRFYIPCMVGNMPQSIKCIKCSQYMKTAVTFECCHGEH